MLEYRKENGFPITLLIHTEPHEDKENNWKGCKSIAMDENHAVIDEFFHKQWHDRALFARGFLKAFDICLDLDKMEGTEKE